jgi:hypothetical protein
MLLTLAISLSPLCDGQLPPFAWVRFLQINAGPQGVATISDSPGAAVFCAIGGDEGVQWVVWMFGSASKSIKRSAQDPRFGLLVSLNLFATSALNDNQGAIPSAPQIPRVREMRYRTPAPHVQQTGHRAARDIPIGGFRLDMQTDLIAAIGGSGADPALSGPQLSLGDRSGSAQELVLLETSQDLLR